MIHIYTVCTEQYIHTVLSTLLLPLLDGLLSDDPGCMVCSIEADVLSGGRLGAWLLQNPPQRNWKAVTDEFDCLDLDLGWFVGRVQFDAVLAAKVSTSGHQVLAKIRFSVGSDMSDFMLTPKFSFLRADFFFDQHDVSHFERESYCAPPHIFPHNEVGS